MLVLVTGTPLIFGKRSSERHASASSAGFWHNSGSIHLRLHGLLFQVCPCTPYIPDRTRAVQTHITSNTEKDSAQTCWTVC